ncbi:MAG: hypothetical protein ACPGTU_06570 [Myxococcota bacterium]
MKKLLLAVVVLILTLMAIEEYARTQRVPRIQHVSPETSPSLLIENGVPTWESDVANKEARQNKACVDKTPDGRADVLLLGDSIFHGVKLKVEDKLGAQIGQRLTPLLGRPACVVNLSEPGFAFENERVVLEREFDSIKPKIVVLEIWGNTPYKYKMAGDSAYNFGRLETAANGFPPVPFVPDTANGWLFVHSAMWRHLNIRLAKKKKGRVSVLWSSMLQDELIPFHSWLESRGTTLMLAFPTALETPFSEPRNGELSVYPVVQEWAEDSGVATLYFQESLAAEDYKKVRLDPCCHLNEYGTQKVAEAMTPWLAHGLRPDASVD